VPSPASGGRIVGKEPITFAENAGLCARAQSNNLKVVEEKGHLSPVAINVTSLNGQVRKLT